MKFGKAIDLNLLKKRLLYLHVAELRDYCEKLSLSIKGKKIFLISRIVHYLETGEKIDLPLYPHNSLAKKGEKKGMGKNTLMLKGAYKNDLKTRLFFKELIGSHFHFTAFGIDWLEERWLAGKPPTYGEFADMWIAETARRKLDREDPKVEWAYINFVKNYMLNNPNANRQEVLEAWKKEREANAKRISELLAAYCS